MFIEAVLIGLFIGGFRGGRISNITDMNIRGWFIILIALLLQISPLIFSKIEFVASLNNYILFASTSLMLIVVLLNLDKKGFWIILIGGLFNLGIIIFNGFSMPVIIENLDKASTLYESINSGSLVNYVISDKTGLGMIFTKFIQVPKPYPFPKILTIGDIIMSIGIVVMAIGEMSKTSYYGKGKMIQYSYGSSFKKR